MDGRLMAIQGEETFWIWEGDAEVPTAFPRATTAWGWPDSPLTQRRGLDEWRDDDFTQPALAPAPTKFLGREAWKVELRPPPRKPFPLTVIVDAVTGLVLSQRNEGFQSISEWTELEVDVDLPDELFEWAGPSQPPPDRDAEHDAEMARRREWLERNGVGPLSLILPIELMLHEQGDDAGFHASLHASLEGSLVRRPRSDAPWEAFMNWPHMHRWSSAAWDWWLGTNQQLSDELLAAIKAQLG